MKITTNETTEMWREYRQHQQEARSERRERGASELQHVRDDGYEVVALTPYQFRVDDALDLYPTRRRYHVLASGQRGVYGNTRETVRRLLGPPRQGNTTRRI